MSTLTVPAGAAGETTLRPLDELAKTLPEGAARDAVEGLAAMLRDGREVIIAGSDDSITPSQAAKILGVSRAHLYKILDLGALPFTVVGKRDRRIAMADLRDYLAKTEHLRRHAARGFAQTHQTRALAIDEM